MKAMRNVGKFSGEGDVERWIDRFELAAEVDDVQNKEAALLSVSLDGPAYDTWKGLDESDRRNAEAIKQALRRAFGLRRLDAWRALLTRNWRCEEPVDSQVEQVKRWIDVATAGGDPRSSMGGLVLLEMLPSRMREQVAQQLGDNLQLAGSCQLL